MTQNTELYFAEINKEFIDNDSFPFFVNFYLNSLTNMKYMLGTL